MRRNGPYAAQNQPAGLSAQGPRPAGLARVARAFPYRISFSAGCAPRRWPLASPGAVHLSPVQNSSTVLPPALNLSKVLSRTTSASALPNSVPRAIQFSKPWTSPRAATGPLRARASARSRVVLPDPLRPANTVQPA